MFKKLTLGVLILIESTPRTSLGVVNTTHTDIVKPWAPNESKSSKSKQALAQQSSCELLRWRNMELYGTACKEVELQASSLNYMKVYVSVCKLMELHASSWNCMQAHETVCKAMEQHARSWNCILHASSPNALEPWETLGNLWLLWGTMGKDEKLTKCKVKNFGYK